MLFLASYPGGQITVRVLFGPMKGIEFSSVVSFQYGKVMRIETERLLFSFVDFFRKTDNRYAHIVCIGGDHVFIA